jgi:hypothetical protein
MAGTTSSNTQASLPAGVRGIWYSTLQAFFATAGTLEWVRSAAFEAGITLSQLTPQLPNLEETFFEMTGEK